MIGGEASVGFFLGKWQRELGGVPYCKLVFAGTLLARPTQVVQVSSQQAAQQVSVFRPIYALLAMSTGMQAMVRSIYVLCLPASIRRVPPTLLVSNLLIRRPVYRPRQVRYFSRTLGVLGVYFRTERLLRSSSRSKSPPAYPQAPFNVTCVGCCAVAVTMVFASDVCPASPCG